MTIKIEELRKATEIVLKNLADQGLNEIEISEDHYWVIDEKEIYDPYNEPKSFTLGQLSFDIEDVKKISTDENPPIGYALVWISSLFRYIGEKHIG